MSNKSKVLGNKSLINCFVTSLVVWSVSVPTGSRVGKGKIWGFDRVVSKELQYHQSRNNKMGGGDLVEHQNLVSLVPEIALCAIDRIEKLKHCMNP